MRLLRQVPGRAGAAPGKRTASATATRNPASTTSSSPASTAVCGADWGHRPRSWSAWGRSPSVLTCRGWVPTYSSQPRPACLPLYSTALARTNRSAISGSSAAARAARRSSAVDPLLGTPPHTLVVGARRAMPQTPILCPMEPASTTRPWTARRIRECGRHGVVRNTGRRRVFSVGSIAWANTPPQPPRRQRRPPAANVNSVGSSGRRPPALPASRDAYASGVDRAHAERGHRRNAQVRRRESKDSFGVYARVLRPGQLHVGDQIRVAPGRLSPNR